jgi:hypothetical protein
MEESSPKCQETHLIEVVPVLKLARLTTVKQLCILIGFVNFYKVF